LRAINRGVRRKAITIALLMAFTFPGVSVPRWSGGVGGEGATGALNSEPIIETVLLTPKKSTPTAEKVALQKRGTTDRQTTARSASLLTGAGSGSTIRASGNGAAEGQLRGMHSSRTAFVMPREGGVVGIGQWQDEVSSRGMVETGRRAVVGGRNVVVESRASDPLVQLQSLLRSVIGSAREIADEFGGHIVGAKRDVLIILLANALIIPVCKRVKLSPILGFLASGILLGPNGLSLLTDVKAMEVLGEMGIVFFLFEMGLELSLSRLKAMKRDVFGLGLSQFLITSAGVAGVCSLAGLGLAQVIVVGGGVALSSSAFVLQLLRDRDDLGTRYGRACFGILLFQVCVCVHVILL
ncbi:unnamed protein product, partial [Choristocarpus tenellus]